MAVRSASRRKTVVAAAVLVALLIALALPAGVDAAGKSKTVEVPLPQDGGVSLAQYRVKVRGADPKAPKAKVRNADQLGDAKVIVSVSRVQGRNYDVTVFALNPRSATAGAAQATHTKVRIRGVGKLKVRQVEAVQDLLVNELQLGDAAAVARFCQDTEDRAGVREKLVRRGLSKTKAGRILDALRVYLCQLGTPEEIVMAEQTLDDLGVLAPECSGTVDEFDGSLVELVIVVTCDEPAEAFVFLAQEGNAGSNCLGPPGSLCAAGAACSPNPVEAVCFRQQGGFPARTPQTFNARWSGAVEAHAGGPFVRGRHFPPGVTSTTEQLLAWIVPKR